MSTTFDLRTTLPWWLPPKNTAESFGSDRRGEKFGMEINCKKTHRMVFSKHTNQKVTIHLNGQPLEAVDRLNYLGSLLTCDYKIRCDIRKKVAEAKKVFSDMKSILLNLKMPMKLRLRILRCHIKPILLYSSETWTLITADRKNLMATGMWFLRRVPKIKRTDKVTNEEVLKRAWTKRRMINAIAKRQASFLCQIIRKQVLKNLAMTGKILAENHEEDRENSISTRSRSGLKSNKPKFYSKWLTRGSFKQSTSIDTTQEEEENTFSQNLLHIT